MKLRTGLQAMFLALAGAAVLAGLVAVALVLQQQDQAQKQILALSQRSMHALASQRLLLRGEAVSAQVADALVNPLYYFDLEAIGAAVGNVLRQPDVSYVIVYDADGNIVHDGSRDIERYGQRMDDPFALEVVAATGQHMQSDGKLLDVSMPIRIGDQRLGGVRIGYSLATAKQDEDAMVATMQARLDEIARRHLVSVGLLLVVLVALGALVAAMLQRRLVRPVRKLADAAQRIEAGHYDVVVPADERQDEIGDLVRAFDRMRDSIARHDRDIRRMAYTDSLTGLANRLALRETLDQRLLEMQGAAGRLALLFADVDDFKRVNDTLGHDAGDEALIQFTARIDAAVREFDVADALLARFGGDEFVVLLQLPDASTADLRTVAGELANRLVQEVARPIEVEGRRVFLGISIGITVFPDDATSAAMLLKNGDIAMYQAKLAGKNCHRFYSLAMDQAVERRMHMEHELRGAWDRGELSLAYQPVFRMGDKALVGVEALLRWQHPEFGNVAPPVFIDVAEQSGLIDVIGPQVLHAACVEARAWQQRYPSAADLFVAVNVSPRQLRGAAFAVEVEAALRESGLSPRHLHLELTETAVIGDEARIGQLLSALRALGVKIWLDDFGTGFSGLSHLRRVPVDGVKIDRSFVADVLRDPDDLALTTAIISMAHSIGITVVAEGVEKEGQFEVLRDRGCDLGQGFWLGHPLPAREFDALLR
ncbi:putative bifunctional diguanylate cyclase/phosphodiesterase [Luteimonas fraxinea]|uniref:putative bifunctional diguanylate cyclase/phosphodiesterase n=1 Tax=Luteimonas fraxinea TaxID=2901869 RepID=UPI001E57E2A2|nr:EAL domain-containing protein [Luteimonas fraxinea]MCD9125566.1 EAL domain-containing protein [Luteimonas fraxinea]